MWIYVDVKLWCMANTTHDQRLPSQPKITATCSLTRTHFSSRRRQEAEFQGSGWLHTKTGSTYRVTSLMRPTPLPLSQTATTIYKITFQRRWSKVKWDAHLQCAPVRHVLKLDHTVYLPPTHLIHKYVDKLHREAEKKEPIFFCVHLFNTWQKLVIFSHSLRKT